LVQFKVIKYLEIIRFKWGFLTESGKVSGEDDKLLICYFDTMIMLTKQLGTGMFSLACLHTTPVNCFFFSFLFYVKLSAFHVIQDCGFSYLCFA
jgi:hypothetical protein